jgi:L-amino acid N-acyltransferase YncA
MKQSLDFRIRLATLDDLPAIRDIYNYYVANSTCTFQLDPETEEERLAWFTSRTPAHPVTVAEIDKEVIAWGSLSRWNSRCAYQHSVEASIYVKEGLHRKGLGRALLIDLIERAKAIGHHTIIGGACSEQQASLALQESVGFGRIGCFHEVGYKFGRWLDVVYMELLLGNEKASVSCSSPKTG